MVGDFKKLYGYWELVPVAKGKKTIAYYGCYVDLRSLKLIDMICKQDPQMEQAIAISSSTVVVKSIKKRAESI